MTDPIQMIMAAKANRVAKGLTLEVALSERPHDTWICHPSSPEVMAKWRAAYIAQGGFILQG